MKPVPAALHSWLLGLLLAVLMPLGAVPAPPAGSGPPPASYPMFGAQFHGTWANYSDSYRDRVLSVLRANGARTVRIDVSWAMLEPAGPGRFDAWGLRTVDNAVRRACAAGMRPLVTLWQAPAWANGSTDPRRPVTSAAGLAGLRSVSARLAARYDPRTPGTPNGWVDAWEVWNEPNDADFMSGTRAPQRPAWAPRETPPLATDPAVYARMLAAAYTGFKSYSPTTTVVFGGVSGTDDVWIDMALTAGAAGRYDVMGVHPYMAVGDAPPDSPDSHNLWTLTHLPAVTAAMARHGDGGKPVWFTEFGWRAHVTGAADANWRRGVSPATQADYLAQTLRLVAARYPTVTRTYWYCDRADSANPAEAGYGLIYPGGVASPALRRAATLPTRR